MKKRILSMLMAIVMVVSLVPAVSITAFAAASATTVKIGEVELNDTNKYYHDDGTANDDPTDAVASWNAETGTLTLEGATLDGKQISCTGGKLTINVVGTNEITNTGSCISAADLVISGSTGGALSLKSGDDACAIDVNADSGNAELLIENCTVNATGIRANSTDNTTVTITNSTVITKSGTNAPCALGVYGTDNLKESATLNILGSDVTVKNGNPTGQCIYVKTTDGAHTAGDNFGEPGATKGGASNINIQDSTVNADNMIGTLSNTTPYRTGAMFILSFGPATTVIDNSRVTLKAINTYTYGFSTQVAANGKGVNDVRIINGSHVESSAYTGFDLRGWGNAFDNKILVKNSYLKATGTSYEGLYVNASKSGAGGTGSSLAEFDNSTVISYSTGYSRGLSVRDKNGHASLNVKGGILVAGSASGVGVYTADGLKPDYSNAGIVVTEAYSNGEFTGSGKVYSDVTLPADYTINANETITLDLNGKTVSDSAIQNNGSLTLTAVGGGEVASALETASGATTKIYGGTYSGAITNNGNTEVYYGSFKSDVSDMVVSNVEPRVEDGYTVYDAKECTVTFNTDGGSEVALLQVEAGTAITEPAAPTKDDYIFAGWYQDEACTTLWNFDEDAVTEDMTLYAKWISAKVTLPAEYIKLDYIEAQNCTGIVTGHTAGSGGIATADKFTVEVSNCSTNTTYGWLVSDEKASISRHFGINNDGTFTLEGGVNMTVKATDDTRRTATMKVLNGGSAASLTVDGETVIRNQGSTINASIKLLGTTASPINAKLYSARFFKESALVANYVPCYGINQGAYGVYDTVAGRFFTADNITGPLVIGSLADVTFNMGEFGTETIRVAVNGKVSADRIPTNHNNEVVIIGWCTDEAGTRAVNVAEQTITESVTFYAKMGSISSIYDENYTPALCVQTDGSQVIDTDQTIGADGTTDRVAVVVSDLASGSIGQVVTDSTGKPGIHFGVENGQFTLEGGQNIADVSITEQNTVELITSVGGATLKVGGKTATRPGNQVDRMYFMGNGNLTQMTAGKLYSAVCYKDGDITAYYLPCFNQNTHQFGLFDTVSRKFYTSITGSPLKGVVEGEHPQATVTFNMDGQAPTQIEMELFETIDVAEIPSAPSAGNVAIAGWYTDPEQTKLWNFSDLVVNDMTLYAKLVTLGQISDPAFLKVGYIEATGEQYIVTDQTIGGAGATAHTFVVDVANLGTAPGSHYAGVVTTSGATQSKHFGVTSGGRFTLEGGQELAGVGIQDRQTVTLTATGDNGVMSATLTAGGRSVTRNTTISTVPLTVYLMGDTSGKLVGKMYSARFYDQDGKVLTAEYLPCYNKTQEAFGFYETLSGKFYPSATSTPFSAGGLGEEFAVVTYHRNDGTGKSIYDVILKGVKFSADNTLFAHFSKTFGGWYLDEACTTPWVDGTVVDENLNLYAKWVDAPSAENDYVAVDYIQSTGAGSRIPINMTMGGSTATADKVIVEISDCSTTASFGMIVSDETEAVAHHFGITHDGQFTLEGGINLDDVSVAAKNTVTMQVSGDGSTATLTVGDKSGVRTGGLSTAHSMILLGTKNSHINAKLYSAKFYKGDTLVADFVPAYQKSTGSYGVFDSVSMRFFKPVGEGLTGPAYAASWSSDNDQHWHAGLASDDETKYDADAHTWGESVKGVQVCSTCSTKAFVLSDGKHVVPTLSNGKVNIAADDGTLNMSSVCEYATTLNTPSVTISSQMKATAVAGASSNANTALVDDTSKTKMKGEFDGGQLRIDAGQAEDKASMRFAYYVTLPYTSQEAFNAAKANGDISWNWVVSYERNGKTYSMNIPGNRSEYKGTTPDGYVLVRSNAVITNIPVEYFTDVFHATLTVTYKLDGVTYTLQQSTPAGRRVVDLAAGTLLLPDSGLTAEYKTYMENLLVKARNNGWDGKDYNGKIWTVDGSDKIVYPS